MLSQISIDKVQAPAAAKPLAQLLARLGGLLLRYGCPTHRLEVCLRLTAAQHGHRAEVFAVPTGLWMSLTDSTDGEVSIGLTRVGDWSVDLSRLCALDGVFNNLAAGRIDVQTAHRQLDQIESASRLYSTKLLVLAGSVATASAAVFFGGAQWPIVLLAAAVGFLVTLATALLGRGRGRLLIDFAAGALTGLALWLVTLIGPELPRRPLLLSGIIIAVPGLTLTAGLSELAQKNIVSGTSRLMEAAMVLVSLVFGLAAAGTIEQQFSGASTLGGVESVASPFIEGIAAFVGGFAFSVLFSVPKRLIPGAVFSGLLAWISTVPNLPALTAAFLGALSVGLFSNLCARHVDRPAQAFLLPGIVLLVPGVFGFVSFSQLLGGQVEAGATGFASTLMTAGALVIGLLFANALLPARKVL